MTTLLTHENARVPPEDVRQRKLMPVVAHVARTIKAQNIAPKVIMLAIISTTMPTTA